MEHKDTLYSVIFNKFRENVINTSYINMTQDEYYDKLLDEYIDKKDDLLSFSLLRKYLSETKPVCTYNQILDIVNINDTNLKIKYNSLFKDELLSKILKESIQDKLLKEDDNYLYFNSKYVYGNNKSVDAIEEENVEYIITIKLDSIEDLAIYFITACNYMKYPYLFEISKNDNTMIIKSDKRYIELYKVFFEKMNIRTMMIEKIIKERKNPLQVIKSRFKK